MEQEIDPTQKGNYVFPFYLQSAPRGFTDTAVARHAHSVCTAAGPATTSQACVTACLASREPCAMKVSTQAPWRVMGRIKLPEACPQTAPRPQVPPPALGSSENDASIGSASLAWCSLCCVLWCHWKSTHEKSTWERILIPWGRNHKSEFYKHHSFFLRCQNKAFGFTCL